MERYIDWPAATLIDWISNQPNLKPQTLIPQAIRSTFVKNPTPTPHKVVGIRRRNRRAAISRRGEEPDMRRGGLSAPPRCVLSIPAVGSAIGLRTMPPPPLEISRGRELTAPEVWSRLESSGRIRKLTGIADGYRGRRQAAARRRQRENATGGSEGSQKWPPVRWFSCIDYPCLYILQKHEDTRTPSRRGQSAV
jgi:hypothetical protein